MNTCSLCNAPLPDDAPGGLCPQCLMKAVLSPGDQIQYFGRYELIEEAGLGGMGVVWRARQMGLDRVVALKMIRGGVLADAEDLKRFQAEAQAAAQLHHPNIVAIHEIGEHEGQHYYSMDFIEGKNLADFCDGKPLPAKQAAELIATIADAVQFAHQHGILHRDLKPQNVMLDANGAPHLTDFGLAKRTDLDSGLTQTGAVLGSPSYMAPEQAQARHDRIGAHTDVYSLGAILYETLTARAPFRGETPAETMMRVINDDPAAPSKIDPTIPRDLETICLKCLEKEPSRRYATARDLAEDARRFLKDEPVVARPASALRKAESWVRRHPWTLAAGSALLVLLLACVVDFLFEQNRFLRAQQITPDLRRSAGARSGELKDWQTLGMFFYIVLAWTKLIMRKQACGLARWRDFWDPKQVWKPHGLLSTRMAVVCLTLALASVSFSFFLLAKGIQAFVWEGATSWTLPVWVFALVTFGLTIIAEALRSLRGGVTIPSLSADALVQIETLIRQGAFASAVKRVRTEAPGTGLAAAHAAVQRMAARLEAATPGTLVDPGVHRKINVAAISICLGAEMSLAIVLFAMAMPHPEPFVLDFVAGFLLGAGLIGGTRAIGIRRKTLLLLPGLTLPLLSAPAPSLRYPDGAIFHGEPYLTGLLFGAALLLCAFLRRKPARK
jgi:Protein kinase domain